MSSTSRKSKAIWIGLVLAVLLLVGARLSAQQSGRYTCVPKVEQPNPEIRISGFTSHVVVVRFKASVNEPNVDALVSILDQAQPMSVLVVVDLTTPGGATVAGQRMARAIAASKVPVLCVADGWVASMGFYALQACQRRAILHGSLLLAHEPYLEVVFHANRYALRTLADRLSQEAEELLTFEVARLRVSRVTFNAHVNGPTKEWQMAEDEALAIGAVDFIAPNLEEAIRLELARPQP